MFSPNRIVRLIIASGLFLAGVAVGVVADLGEAMSNDSRVKESVYGDAVLRGVARQDTDGRVFWYLPNGKEIPARFDP